ncbi:pentapeptide repeat-containing protein [Catenulispora pinisilvae]|uniref:pentapeptide repeat-containing protein n=1 Tax=Catenulispora pinisilvae TaxID=2705253 RepID=UPI001890C223|nr:pentapeptide repeat-containing protein [Catenulispora pinisilvae]
MFRIGLVVCGVLGALTLLGLVVGPLTWLIAGGSVRRLSGKDQADALNAVRQTLLAALVGVAGLGGLAFTARTYYLSRRGQVTDRFSVAIGHLASKELAERLGGIYALEHIMAESAREHGTVLEVLCAFVRARAPRHPRAVLTGPSAAANSGTRLPEPAADIDAVLTVLARRPRRPEPNRPDLRATDLSGLILRAFEFTSPPNLTRVFLTGADLRDADLRGLDLSLTILSDADLGGAFLHNANLTDATLTRAYLSEARMAGTVLTGAHLTETDLSGVVGLTAGQLADAVIDAETTLPDVLRDDPWVAARLADCLAWFRVPDESGDHLAPARTPQPSTLS